MIWNCDVFLQCQRWRDERLSVVYLERWECYVRVQHIYRILCSFERQVFLTSTIWLEETSLSCQDNVVQWRVRRSAAEQARSEREREFHLPLHGNDRLDFLRYQRRLTFILTGNSWSEIHSLLQMSISPERELSSKWKNTLEEKKTLSPWRERRKRTPFFLLLPFASDEQNSFSSFFLSALRKDRQNEKRKLSFERCLSIDRIKRRWH